MHDDEKPIEELLEWSKMPTLSIEARLEARTDQTLIECLQRRKARRPFYDFEAVIPRVELGYLRRTLARLRLRRPAKASSELR